VLVLPNLERRQNALCKQQQLAQAWLEARQLLAEQFKLPQAKRLL
jgi:hypothetical protein